MVAANYNLLDWSRTVRGTVTLHTPPASSNLRPETTPFDLAWREADSLTRIRKVAVPWGVGVDFPRQQYISGSRWTINGYCAKCHTANGGLRWKVDGGGRMIIVLVLKQVIGDMTPSSDHHKHHSNIWVTIWIDNQDSNIFATSGVYGNWKSPPGNLEHPKHWHHRSSLIWPSVRCWCLWGGDVRCSDSQPSLSVYSDILPYTRDSVNHTYPNSGA